MRIVSRQLPNLTRLTQRDLLHYFRNSWQLNEVLFKSFQPEALYQRPDPLRNPLIFYLGHTAAFYINKSKRAKLLSEGINDRYENIFERGVDPETPKESEAVKVDWPTEEATWHYRMKAYQTIEAIIKNLTLNDTITPEHPVWSLLMGFEHDRIHFETSSVLIRQLPITLMKKPDGLDYAPFGTQPDTNRMVYVPTGRVILGKKDHASYGWDNEYGQLTVDVPAFEASTYLISNKEYLEFIENGGYNNPAYWTEEGWAWKQKVNSQHPIFWVKANHGGYYYRAIWNEMEMPLHWPAEVNHFEATAYCQWKGSRYRLLSEGEFNWLAKTDPMIKDEIAVPHGYNLNLHFASPSPVDACVNPNNHYGFGDVYGNVWQWLSNNFYPLPGFKHHDLYPDFSKPYFDDRHSMLLGGSWASTGESASQYYRLWFRRFFHQHAGFRIAATNKEHFYTAPNAISQPEILHSSQPAITPPVSEAQSPSNTRFAFFKPQKENDKQCLRPIETLTPESSETYMPSR